jgi:hypothetical protein
MWFQKLYWRFYWGSWNGFQNASGRNLGSCLWIDGFGKALKPLPVVKTDADGKPMMHLIQNNVTASLCRFDGKRSRKRNV